ncbi:hypothetical protein B4134_0537 [Bacillus safensis]|uniref:hypothetical protein n=1 Tax=Bacillus TaxID=1386 RepID=UPI000596CDEA|nr:MULTISPECIES: hypothetical protein [Bacillus]KIL25121.1 hypothetical protein B4134_0537 [Bacillus safensis]MED1530538.1 hypothetical protein [Bacillus altitudinis]UUH74533.1 hypothetical protein NP445_01240 [Bacillus altitudinis]
MSLSETKDIMKKAVSLAKHLEGDWPARMKMALNNVYIDHYLSQPMTREIVEKLLLKGMSFRRIKKHYKVGMDEISSLLAK